MRLCHRWRGSYFAIHSEEYAPIREEIKRIDLHQKTWHTAVVQHVQQSKAKNVSPCFSV